MRIACGIIVKWSRNQTFEVAQPSSKLSRQSWEVFEFVDMFLINKYGRNFKPGIPLSKDFRNEVIQMAASRPISGICERYHINRSNVWLPSMSCLRPIRTCFSFTCPRLDENDCTCNCYCNFYCSF